MHRTLIAAAVLAVAGATFVAAPAVADDVPHAVTVTVTSNGGTPLPGALVELLDPTTSDLVTLQYIDTAGVATFPAVATGSYTVYVDAYAATARADLVVGDADAALVVPVDGISVLSAHVRDAVSGAHVDGLVQGTPAVAGEGFFFADYDNGSGFTTVVQPGRYYLQYSATEAGYLTSGYPDAVGQQGTVIDLRHDVTDLEVTLHREPRISGRVTMLGAPVANAPVRLQGGSPAPVTAGGELTTGSDGRYAVTEHAGTYYPSVNVGELATASYFTTYYGNTVRRPDAKKVTAAVDGVVANVDIALVAKATVTGTVVTRSGKPAKNVAVEAYNLTRAGSVQGTTDSHGRFTLRGLASGAVAVAAYGEGVSSPVKRVSAVQGKAVSTALKLTDDARLAATIRTLGSKPTSQDVSLFDAHHALLGTFRPDSLGRIGLWSLPAGTYYLTIDGSNVQKKLTLKAHQHLNLGTLTRGRLVTVSGTVKTAAGKPAVGALVLVMDARKTVYKRTRTDAHGHYSVKAAVSGSYRVTVDPTSVTVDAYGTVALKVTAGHAAKANVRLTRPGTVTGRVLNAQGKPAVGVHVLTLSGRDVRTNASGVFTITGLHAGTTYLFETDRDYVGGYRDASEVVTVHAGRTTTVATIRIP